MRYRNILLLLAAWFTLYSANAIAQNDTVRIMQYNLLNYGNSANPYSYKDQRLKAILDHAQPDIFGANEIAGSSAHSQNILSAVLGSGWEKAAFSNQSGEIQTNMLFWKSDKFSLKQQQLISYNVRDIIAYTLYYKDVNLPVTKDTIFVTIIVAHLKAGDAPSDESRRNLETQTVVNYLNSLGVSGNYIFMGDFNVYSSSEPCYSNMINAINPNSRMYDPINKPGAWTANSSFAAYHTQSTRSSNMPDGGAGGGLDDRFDQILVSDQLMQGTKKMKCLTNTYTAVGQDGNHYNRSVNASPANNAAPGNVIQALYEMSDHLPVMADFSIHPEGANSVAAITAESYGIRIGNPVGDRVLLTLPQTLLNTQLDISLYAIDGRQLLKKSLICNETMASVALDNMSYQGLCVINISSGNKLLVRSKLIKQ